MLFALLLLIALVLVFYFKLVVPFFYWKKRDVFYVTPWARFFRVFLGKGSFAGSVIDAYNEFPNRRYYGSYQFLQPSLFVRDLDLVKRIAVKDFEHFTDHFGITSDKTDPILGLNLFSLKGKRWREMRSTLSPAFTSSKMKMMFGLIQETAANFTDHFVKTCGETEVMTLQMRQVYAKYTNDVIANCAFGIKCDSLTDETNEFYAMGRYVTSTSGGRLIRALLYGFFPKIFEKIITDTINVREKENLVRPDMIHLLMEARKGRLVHENNMENDTGFATVEEAPDDTSKNKNAIEITDDVITAQALVFFIAGFSTASSLMAFLSYELATHPEILKKLQTEIETFPEFSYDDVSKMKYLDQVVCEALRKYPPGYVLNRICVKDYVIPAKNSSEKTIKIEEGCLIALPTIAIHYDATYFPEPYKFDPERFSDENKSNIVPGSYIPFGLGPRNCIGSRFALLEMKILMANLLSKFDLVVVEKTAIPMEFAKTLGLEAKGGIWLGLKRRS